MSLKAEAEHSPRLLPGGDGQGGQGEQEGGDQLQQVKQEGEQVMEGRPNLFGLTNFDMTLHSCQFDETVGCSCFYYPGIASIGRVWVKLGI